MNFLISVAIGWLLFKILKFRPPRGQLNCGIFGYSGSRPVDLTKLKWLAVENQSRGIDSTGVYGNHLFKEREAAKRVVVMPGFNAATKGARTVQGHTRSASAGYQVSKENAHPFHYGFPSNTDDTTWAAEVVGAHNGFVIPEMLKHHEETFGFKQEFKVDSQLIFAALAKTGDVNVISKIEGGMAISFQMLSHNPHKLYLYKREQTRPLFIGEASDGLYYSSLEEPLHFIGCKTVWEVNPNYLYTLELGEVVDIYKMPLPVLKSLAANVTRGSWRQGVPRVELDALPKSAISQTKFLAFGKDDNNNYNSSNYGNSRGFSQNKDVVTTRVSKEYSDKDSLNSKFNMLIKNISDELTKLDAYPVELSSAIREEDHLVSCTLVIKVITSEHRKGLAAWAVLADGDRDLAGITSANGITVIKIPVDKCKQDIKFYAYCPIEQYGPYAFTVTPHAARVVEVTLSIPFLKKGLKKEEIPSFGGDYSSDETGCGSGQTECSLSASPFKSEELHGDGEVVNSGILSKHTTQVPWGCSKEQIDRLLSGEDATNVTIPESDLDIRIGPQLEERIKQTLPRLKSNAQTATISVALDLNDSGGWKNYPGLSQTIIAWSLSNPDRARTLQFYSSHFYSKIRTSELILDATRLMQRDKYITGVWFPFWVYVELLLRNFDFKRYVRPSLDASKLNAEEFYPSTWIKKSGDNTSTTTSPSYQVYSYFLDYMVGYNVYMTKQKKSETVSDLTKHRVTIANHVMNLNDMLHDESSLSISQRAVIINVRNTLRLEYEDLQTFLDKLEKD